MTAKTPAVSKSIQALRGARLAAVQALFQIELTSKPVDYVVREFNEYRISDRYDLEENDESGEAPLFANREFFGKLVNSASEDIIMLDAQIEKRLAKDWSLGRIDPIARSVLRCAVYELMNYLNIPVVVIINEYVSIIASFGDGKNAGFVNGILEKIAGETGAVAAREAQV